MPSGIADYGSHDRVSASFSAPTQGTIGDLYANFYQIGMKGTELDG
jgi:hypothetical protein